MTRVSLIVARASNGVIGLRGSIPWRLRDDERFFRRQTLGKTVIIGRTTFDSMGYSLLGRDVVVLSRSLPGNWYEEGYGYRHVTVESSLTNALLRAYATSSDEALIAGGAEVYRRGLRYAETVYLTQVHARPAGDTYFKHWFAPWTWRETMREELKCDQQNEHAATIRTLRRRWFSRVEEAGEQDVS